MDKNGQINYHGRTSKIKVNKSIGLVFNYLDKESRGMGSGDDVESSEYEDKDEDSEFVPSSENEESSQDEDKLDEQHTSRDLFEPTRNYSDHYGEPWQKEDKDSTEEDEESGNKDNNNNNRFTCKECDRRFFRLNSLQRHMKIHQKVKPFECTVCGKRFTFKSYLQKHQQTRGVKKFKCNICGRLFTIKEKVNHHYKLVHEEVKPYKCETIGKSFAVKYKLTMHEKIHIDIRPYECSICKLSFKHKDYIKRHILTHSKERPYKCSSVCDKTFKSEVALNGHQKTVHEKANHSYAKNVVNPFHDVIIS